MNYSDIIFFDFETGSANPHNCQPIQLAAIAIKGRQLTIHQDGFFNSYIQPYWTQEECNKYGLAMIEDETLEINKISRETLLKAPPLKLVWQQFTEFVNKYNPKKSKYYAPIKSGYNINRFDNIIIDRICGGNLRTAKKLLDKIYPEGKVTISEPYGFGNWDAEREECTLFNVRDTIDLMNIVWYWTENNKDVKSISFDSISEWLGINKEGNHNAEVDVKKGSEVLIRFLHLARDISVKVKWKNETASQS